MLQEGPGLIYFKICYLATMFLYQGLAEAAAITAAETAFCTTTATELCFAAAEVNLLFTAFKLPFVFQLAILAT